MALQSRIPAVDAGSPLLSVAGVRDPRITRAEYGPEKLLALVRMIERRGIACEHWFEGLPVSRQQLDDPQLRVSYRTTRQFVARALTRLRLPAAGLVAGGLSEIGDFGLLGLAMLTSGTLGEALAAAMDNYRTCGCVLDLELEPARHDSVVALAVRLPYDDAELEPYFCEELFASCVAVARQLVGGRFRPLRMEFRYPAPVYVEDYLRHFDCPVVFARPRNRMLVDTHWLGHRLSGHNPLTSRHALALCAQQRQPQGVARQDIVEYVQRLLRERIDQHPRLGEVARVLNLSERTLRRRLAANGLVFREILDQVRAEQALRLLNERGMSVAEVGVRIGFEDPREFRRAFKRWTGMAPMTARTRAEASLRRRHDAASA